MPAPKKRRTPAASRSAKPRKPRRSPKPPATPKPKVRGAAARPRPTRGVAPGATRTSRSIPRGIPSGFNAPERGPAPAESILVAYAPGERDPGLDEYIRIMGGLGHEVLEVEVTEATPAAARQELRGHPAIRAGAVGGIIIAGRGLRPFTFSPRQDSGPLPDSSDLPFGSDFAGYDIDPGERLVAATLAEQFEADPAGYRQAQWVSRIFRFHESFLANLASTLPPQVNNMLIVNADPNSDDPVIQDRWRQRYSLLTLGQNARYAFRGSDFGHKELLAYLEENVANTTFLSLTDHGNSTNLENLPGLRNGAPRLPGLPDVVELAACATGRWTDDAETPEIKGLAETSLERGALAVIAPQCLLAWNFVRGSVGRPAHYDPVAHRNDQEIHNVAPWLDVWPLQGSLGRAQCFAVNETLGFLRESAYSDKGYLTHHVLCGHSLFGDGTVEFRSL